MPVTLWSSTSSSSISVPPSWKFTSEYAFDQVLVHCECFYGAILFTIPKLFQRRMFLCQLASPWKSMEVVPNFLHVCLFSSHKFQSNFKPPKTNSSWTNLSTFLLVFLLCGSIGFFFWHVFLGGEKRGRVSRWSPVSGYHDRDVDHSMPSTSTPTWKAPPSFTLGVLGLKVHSSFFVWLLCATTYFVFLKGSSKRGESLKREFLLMKMPLKPSSSWKSFTSARWIYKNFNSEKWR